MVDEQKEFISGDALGVGCPVAPLEFIRDDGGIALADEFEFLIFLIEDFQEEHPAELLKALGIAGDSGIFVSHDVADIFNDGRDVGHGKVGSEWHGFTGRCK